MQVVAAGFQLDIYKRVFLICRGTTYTLDYRGYRHHAATPE